MPIRRFWGNRFGVEKKERHMSLRILIADDEPLLRRDLKEVLEYLGYCVVAEAVIAMLG